jgi:GDP-L-fucose synthase
MRPKSRTVVIWGTGTPRREFLYGDDFANACVLILENYSGPPEFVNIGVGQDMSIAEFAQTAADAVGYCGKISYDSSKPDVTPRKLVDVSPLSGLGWKAKLSIQFRKNRRGLHAFTVDS